MLRAKSMECISLVGMAVGKEKFRADAKQDGSTDLETVNTQQIHSSTSENAMNLSSDVHVLPEASVSDTEIKPNDLPSHNGFEHVHVALSAPLLAEVVDRMPILYQYYTHSISSNVGEGEDDDTYDPSKHDFESGDDEDHTLTRDCNGLYGAKVGGYSGYHYVLINLPM
ncbi:hypothetical protein KIW84_056011 [Lathyrus oleraceus]|uniref:Uncharacterized protein n=1 Tax=Pisum sativum TaxID=3888 RepID=A0A9D5AM11_PEA|nr:hypothetical protein KIW84_056011 [Pisum sativum]